MTTRPQIKTVRCAIYERVSTDFGLEQDFNSLDAQREACEAYIKSQTHEGWRLVKDRFSDGGFSGASIDRPALQSLLAEIRARKLDVVVVYKVDRLTRSLSDFAKLVELFDAHGVSFVSVTQSFNTTTSMGRLTLNVLLSFAQFEREVTAERIRDKIAASKKKGMWMGGTVPLGYRVEDRRLLVEPEEAETVRLIFARYRELRSLPALQRDLRERGIVTRVRELASGRRIGGVPLTNGPLVSILRNRTYIGEINHRGESYPGQHEPIIERSVFEDVQAILDSNRQGRRDRWRSSHALLLGKLYDDRGNRMTPSYAIKKGVRYRYYVSCVLAQGRKSEAGSVPRVAANEIENHVCDALKSIGKPISPIDGREVAEKASEALREIVDRVTVSTNEITIELSDAGDEPADPIRILWTPPRRTRHHGLIRNGQDEAAHIASGVRRSIKGDVRARIIVAIARARVWLDQLVSSEVPNIEAIARREHRSERSVRMALSLAFLASDIIEAAVKGTLAPGIALADLTDLPLDWAEQRESLGLH
jgi:site-specific DNA recombinase